MIFFESIPPPGQLGQESGRDVPAVREEVGLGFQIPRRVIGIDDQIEPNVVCGRR